jgi:hypothetical protein
MFKFTIRDLLWMTVVGAALAAWWVARLDSSPVLKEKLRVLQVACDNERAEHEAERKLLEQKIGAVETKHGRLSAWATGMQDLVVMLAHYRKHDSEECRAELTRTSDRIEKAAKLRPREG